MHPSIKNVPYQVIQSFYPLAPLRKPISGAIPPTIVSHVIASASHFHLPAEPFPPGNGLLQPSSDSFSVKNYYYYFL